MENYTIASENSVFIIDVSYFSAYSRTYGPLWFERINIQLKNKITPTSHTPLSLMTVGKSWHIISEFKSWHCCTQRSNIY